MICAIDTETTGLLRSDEILSMAFVPLTKYFNRDEGVRSFDIFIRPDKVWDGRVVSVNRITLDFIEEYGIDKKTARELFMGWVDERKIFPLAQNWPFDKMMLEGFLGETVMEKIFERDFRDTKSLASALNDLAVYSHEPEPFNKTSLGSLCNKLFVHNKDPHNAISDAIATAECYRKMLELLYNWT